MQEIIEKYSDNVIKNLNADNFRKIVVFLQNYDCNYIDDIVSDYLDLFTIDYILFVEKFNLINNKYDGRFLEIASENMQLFEEFLED